MCKMYGIIEELCRERGIKPGKMCADLGISRGVMGDLKAGRTKKLSAENIEKVSRYFGVPDERQVSDEDIKFALFGGDGEITDAMYDEVKRFAKMVKLREEAEREKK